MKSVPDIIEELKNWKDFDLLNHPINKILEGYSKGTRRFKKGVQNELNKINASKEEGNLYEVISIMLYDGVDPSYLEMIRNLLLSQVWNGAHEDLVALLTEIDVPENVDILYKTAQNVPEWDAARALAKKCIWALGSIKTDDAMDKLKALTRCQDSLIAELAEIQLKSII